MEKPAVLYIDDEKDNLVVFKASFHRDYEIYTTISPHEGLKILSEHPIEVLLTDQRMPDMTGTELLKIVLPDYPDVIRIIVTAYSDIEVVLQAVNNCGIYKYITKPWDKHELKITLDNAVAAFRLKKENKRLIQDLRHSNGALNQKVDELESANKQLTSYALRLAEKNENFKGLMKGLEQTYEQIEASRARLKTHIHEINQSFRLDADWKDFIQVFDKVHTGFVVALKAAYPNLTASELRLCAMIRMNMQSKEIASFLNISPQSVNMARYRLRQKMNLDKEQSLEETIIKL